MIGVTPLLLFVACTGMMIRRWGGALLLGRYHFRVRWDDGMLVRRVVVGDQVQRLFLRRFAVDFLQELQPLDVGVPLLTLTMT